MAKQEEITRPLATKKVDHFYVSFFGMEDNDANILGRQVESIERPVINFNPLEVRHKGIKQERPARVEYQSFSIVFYDDSESLTARAIYNQIKRQTGTNDSPNGTFDNAKFNIRVKVYNVESKVVEQIDIKHCYIQSVTHSEFIVSESTNNRMTVTVVFNDMDYSFPNLED